MNNGASDDDDRRIEEETEVEIDAGIDDEDYDESDDERWLRG